MLIRTVALFSIGLAAVLFGASQSEAQPGGRGGFGKGPKGPKGPEAGADIQKLEKDLNRLLDQVKQTQAQLERMKDAKAKKGGRGPRGGNFDGKWMDGVQGKGKGIEGNGQRGGMEGTGKGFEGKGPWGRGGKGKGFEGNWKGGFGGWGRGGPAMGSFAKGAFKLDPDTIKLKYEFYKRLYEESQRNAERGKSKGRGGPGRDNTPPKKGRGFGGGAGGPGSPGSSNVEARIDRLIRELEAIRSEVRGGGKKR